MELFDQPDDCWLVNVTCFTELILLNWDVSLRFAPVLRPSNGSNDFLAEIRYTFCGEATLVFTCDCCEVDRHSQIPVRVLPSDR
jgi:hypothetical protein